MNPFQAFNQVIQQYNAIKNNPQEIGKLLLNSGRINQDHYNAIKDMNSPSQIGNYLINNGILGQQQAQQFSQVVPQIQQMMQSGGMR